MDYLEKYARQRLKDELHKIHTRYSSVLPELTDVEKAVIHWYSENGYESLNEKLRDSKGKNMPPLGEFLNLALSKLPNHEDIVFRGMRYYKSRVEKYQTAFDKKEPVIEYSFTSTSTSDRVARMFGNGIFLEIFSKTGKNIDNVTKYGLTSGQNEKEVLFKSSTPFYVIDIQHSNQYAHIILQEV